MREGVFPHEAQESAGPVEQGIGDEADDRRADGAVEPEGEVEHA